MLRGTCEGGGLGSWWTVLPGVIPSHLLSPSLPYIATAPLNTRYRVPSTYHHASHTRNIVASPRPPRIFRIVSEVVREREKAHSGVS